MNKRVIMFAVGLAVVVPVHMAIAQRGTGQQEGVARQRVKPTVESIAGELSEIRIGPCEHTTGRSLVGTHLILKSDDGERNLHLGPMTEVQDVVAQLQIGDRVEATVFRTPRLPENQYIAVSVVADEQQFVLRGDSLRPRWAGGGGRGAGQGPMGGRWNSASTIDRGRLVTSTLLKASAQIDLTEEQVEQIEVILTEAEDRVRLVLTESQRNALSDRPAAGRGRGLGPRGRR